MKNQKWKLSILSLVLFTPICSIAKVHLDRRVTNFMLKPPPRLNERARVVVLFRSELREQNSQTPIEKEKQLIDLNLNLIKSTLIPLAGTRAEERSLELQPLWIANSMIVSLTSEQIKKLSSNNSVASIVSADRKISLDLPESHKPSLSKQEFTYGLAKLGIPELRKKYPHLKGGGIRIGVIDTGIDSNHSNLKGRLDLFKDFSPKPSLRPVDTYGHGTHVSGTIAGSADESVEFGIAPEAKLVVARIFDANLNSTVEGILLSLQWMADPDGNPNTADAPVAVNNSWGDDEPYNQRDPKDEPFCSAVQNLLALEIAPIFSAGNSGPRPGTIGLPAGCPDAISIGATNKNDDSPHFSSEGPAKWKTISIVKPELVAPGVDVYSSTPGDNHEEMSGTSMASPHVTGAYALLKQARPNLKVTDALKALIDGSVDLGRPGKDNTFGHGRINVLRAIESN